MDRVNWFGATARAFAAVTIAVAVSAACTNTTSGIAVRADGGTPADVRALEESQLDDVLLSLAQLNGIAGGTSMEVMIDSDGMSDNSDAVSDPDCLGSIFGAEELVYRSSHWTAVRDQVVREPGYGNEHWMEQTAVLYPSEKLAADFVEESTSAWRDCAGFSVAVEDQTTSSIWLIDEVVIDGEVVTQTVAQEDSDGWECQHAMTSVANLAIEALACAFGINDEAVSMVNALVANAARQ
jgi:hypothetical protein